MAHAVTFLALSHEQKHQGHERDAGQPQKRQAENPQDEPVGEDEQDHSERERESPKAGGHTIDGHRLALREQPSEQDGAQATARIASEGVVGCERVQRSHDHTADVFALAIRRGQGGEQLLERLLERAAVKCGERLR